MTDYGQQVYDAIRSKFSGDWSSMFERALRDSLSSCDWWAVQQEFANAAVCQRAPSVLYKPKVFIDGDHWCALYGDNLQDGVAGFGKTPLEAMTDFDRAFHEPMKAAPAPEAAT